MLKSRSAKRRLRKTDWYPVRQYMHFDGPLARADATKLVTDQNQVARHSFLPLMSFSKRDRRYRRRRDQPTKITYKTRHLVYCSNRDTCIFGYYAHLLFDPYEHLIKALDLDNVVIGYRRIGSNIDLAKEAFSEIKLRGSCVAFGFDISGFFDNIDHAVLKRNWCRVLDKPRLPNDHFAVFKALTKFSTVDRRACLRRLGYKPNARDRDLPHPPLCSIADFRTKIRADDGSVINLVVPWTKAYRIPQGTPLSALAANIAMIDFDIAVNAAVKKLGGSYRRYSDDILVIVPAHHRHHVRPIVDLALRSATNGLRINKKKTEEVEFAPGALVAGQLRPLQYLGFLFDGKRTLIRSNTLSKYWRRAHRVVRWALGQHIKALAGNMPAGRLTRTKIHKRSAYARLTDLGAENFITGYGKNAKNTICDPAIAKQLSKLSPRVRKMLD